LIDFALDNIAGEAALRSKSAVSENPTHPVMQTTAKCTVIRQASVSMASVRIASYLLKPTAPEMSGWGQLYTQEP
jgi:hypothetical protein